jgi:sugar (pentulose or hexulose) kinase
MNHEQYFLGIDLGTSYFKAGLFDPKGKLVGLGRQFVRKETDGKICELPVPVFWSVLRECIGEAMKNAKINPGEIRALSYSSQANSFILLDRNDQPLTSLILWPDNRAEKIYKFPAVAGDAGFCSQTGLGIAPGHQFCVAKINWYQELQPSIWKQVRRIMSISDYLVFSLTGQRLSDYSTAAMTGLFNISTCQWWDQMLDNFNIRLEYLSIPQRTGTTIGKLTVKGAQTVGLDDHTLFCLGGLDHHLAGIGAGLLFRNWFSESTGTVLACVAYKDQYMFEKGICTAPGLDPDHFFQMLFDENGASSLEWYQSHFAGMYNISQLMEMAAKVEPGSRDLIAAPCVNHYEGLDGFHNVQKYHDKAHFVKAILESTALSLDNIFKILKGNVMPEAIIATGGGAKSRIWAQIKADLTGMDFLIPECTESACLGAAMLSATATNDYVNLNEITGCWMKIAEQISPDSKNREKYMIWLNRNKNILSNYDSSLK